MASIVNANFNDIVGFKMAFGRHETFHLSDGWLTKGLDAIHKAPAAFLNPNAHHDLGIGINMAKSIRYWLEASGLCQVVEVDMGKPRMSHGLELTEMGRLLLKADRYFEAPGSSWLIHLNLALSVELAPVWYWSFNLTNSAEFSIENLEGEVLDYAEMSAYRAPTAGSVRKDVRCFVRTYLQVDGDDKLSAVDDPLGSPLSSLGLIVKTKGNGRYRIDFGNHPSLPIEIFLYVLYSFAAGESVLSFDSARWRPNSTGRILCIDTDEIRALISKSQAKYGSDVVSEVQTAGLDSIHLNSTRAAVDFISDYYDGLRGGAAL